MNYQTYYLKRAVEEYVQMCFKDEKEHMKRHPPAVRVDHHNGCNYINGIKRPVTFPLYLRQHIDSVPKDKSCDYFYRGFDTSCASKKWVLPYRSRGESPHVIESGYGRSDGKYRIDENYIRRMCAARFALCPTAWESHKTSWTYRFFEAILCLALPVLRQGSKDQYQDDFHCLYDGEEHVYDERKALENYYKLVTSDHFLRRHMFQPPAEEGVVE